MFLYQVIHHLSHPICPIPSTSNGSFKVCEISKNSSDLFVASTNHPLGILMLPTIHQGDILNLQTDLLPKIATKKCLTSFIDDLKNIGTSFYCSRHAYSMPHTGTKDPFNQMSFSIKNEVLMKMGQEYLRMQWATFKYIGNILWAFECPKSWLSINPIPLTHAN